MKEKKKKLEGRRRERERVRTEVGVDEVFGVHEFHYTLWGAGAPCSNVFLLSGNDVVVVGMFVTWHDAKDAGCRM